MKKSVIVIIVLVLLGILAYTQGTSFYNNAIDLEENATAQWSKVESAYQRRADLIPNIVNTAKGYAEFEQETLTKVIEARSKATAVTIDPTSVTPEQLQQFEQVQGSLNSALARLLAVFERYPDLKANENFKELINELERTENRINVERNRFADTAKDFNKHLKKFPNNVFNGVIGNFDELAYFEAAQGTDQAPVVDFD